MDWGLALTVEWRPELTVMVAGVASWLPARRLVALSPVCCVGLTGRREMAPWQQLSCLVDEREWVKLQRNNIDYRSTPLLACRCNYRATWAVVVAKLDMVPVGLVLPCFFSRFNWSCAKLGLKKSPNPRLVPPTILARRRRWWGQLLTDPSHSSRIVYSWKIPNGHCFPLMYKVHTDPCAGMNCDYSLMCAGLSNKIPLSMTTTDTNI
jgi:hypothetical protein